jgi:hypothetical protein
MEVWTPDAVDRFTVTLERPIFVKERQPGRASLPPAPVVASAAAPAVVQDPVFTVQGFLANGTVRRAFVVAPGHPQGAWLLEGDGISGWRVKAIGANHVTLENGSRTMVVRQFPEP